MPFVLIVEHNAGVRRLLRTAVAGIAAVTWDCCDGADALEAFTMHQPDIVLMDIRMPIMDGLAATRQIRLVHPNEVLLERLPEAGKRLGRPDEDPALR